MIQLIAAVPGTTVLAHGVQGRAETPVPLSLFIVAAAVVVLVSFVGLGTAWSRPRWTHVAWRPAPELLNRVVLAPVLVTGARVLVLIMFLGVLGAAMFGSTLLNRNIAPVTIFVLWWIGLVPVALLLGNVWRELNPWATLARLLGAPPDTGDRPPRWGMWPAAVLMACWAWLELVYPTAAAPRLLAGLVIGYSVLTVAAMRRYGTDTWLDRGEAFTVYSGLIASLSVVEVRHTADGRRLGFRPPLLGSTLIAQRPGLVAFVCVLVGSVTFDGLSGTRLWAGRDRAATQRLVGLGLDDFPAGIAVATIGLLAMIGLAAAAFIGACAASDRVARLREDATGAGVTAAFAHTLVPIAVGYHVAHYFTLFVFQTQDLRRLVSDPFGAGTDYFGTAGSRIDFTVVAPDTIWAVQIATIVIAHVLGLMLAHDRALQISTRPQRVARSQYAMLTLMITLTVGGLWFLSEGMTTTTV